MKKLINLNSKNYRSFSHFILNKNDFNINVVVKDKDKYLKEQSRIKLSPITNNNLGWKPEEKDLPQIIKIFYDQFLNTNLLDKISSIDNLNKDFIQNEMLTHYFGIEDNIMSKTLIQRISYQLIFFRLVELGTYESLNIKNRLSKKQINEFDNMLRDNGAGTHRLPLKKVYSSNISHLDKQLHKLLKNQDQKLEDQIVKMDELSKQKTGNEKDQNKDDIENDTEDIQQTYKEKLLEDIQFELISNIFNNKYDREQDIVFRTAWFIYQYYSELQKQETLDDIINKFEYNYDFMNPYETFRIIQELNDNDLISEKFKHNFYYQLGLNLIHSDFEEYSLVKCKINTQDRNLLNFDVESTENKIHLKNNNALMTINFDANQLKMDITFE